MCIRDSPQNTAIEGHALNSDILPLYRVEAVPSNFDAAKPDAPLFRAPLYRATYCKANDKRVILAQTTCSIHIADIAAGQLWITAKYENDPGQRRAGATTTDKYPGFISNRMLIRRTLHEMSVYTHRVDNMAEGSAGMT